MMESLGYLGIGMLMFLENLFPPIPSELIMPLAGFTISQGKMGFLPAIAAGTIGTVLGAFPWYFVGYFFGEARLKAWADRYGKWITVSSKDIDKAVNWFNRHGGKAVFLGRLVPGVRTLISLPAGLAGMNFPLFLLYSTIGTVIWTTLLTWLGYALGENYDEVDHYLGPVSKIVLLSLGIGFGLWIWRRQQRTNHP
ncbi:DedA family protein [Leptolyngbya sp. PL-A3]|nr:DedA family protein [Leptolyngbya sp. FACHB-8]